MISDVPAGDGIFVGGTNCGNEEGVTGAAGVFAENAEVAA